jgi:RNA polymerase sigma factor (TIGR02999 family)
MQSRNRGQNGPMSENNSSTDSSAITGLLLAWRSGNQEAGHRLIELVYHELHRIASRQMNRENSQHALQTTALVHETYLRLCDAGPINWQDRRHFFAVASQQMRRILVDHTRRVKSDKRGGGQQELPLLESDGGASFFDERLLAVDEALSRLQTLDERAAKVVELRFFGGLSENETAGALDISLATLKRDWDFARTWLASQLTR